MRGICLVLPAVIMLASCSEPVSEPDTAQEVAEIKAINAGTDDAEPIDPQAIRYPDIEKHEIYGAGCSFTPEGGGIAAIAVALIDAGYLKIGDEVEKLAPDMGSAETPYGTQEKYDGLERSMRLTLAEKDGEQTGAETLDYDAALEIRDAKDRVVYDAEGYAQCGA